MKSQTLQELRHLFNLWPRSRILPELHEDALQEAAIAWYALNGSPPPDDGWREVARQLLALAPGDPVVTGAMAGPEAPRYGNALLCALRFLDRERARMRRHPEIPLAKGAALYDQQTVAEALRYLCDLRHPIKDQKRPWHEVDERIDLEWNECGQPPYRVDEGSSEAMGNPDFLPDPGPAARGEISYRAFCREVLRRTPLTPRQHAALVLRFRGYTQEEIAEELDISQPAVSRLLSKARRKIRKYKDFWDQSEEE